MYVIKRGDFPNSGTLELPCFQLSEFEDGVFKLREITETLQIDADQFTPEDRKFLTESRGYTEQPRFLIGMRLGDYIDGAKIVSSNDKGGPLKAFRVWIPNSAVSGSASLAKGSVGGNPNQLIPVALSTL